MSEETKIQWCDSTASPWTICSKVSPGCEHCYAADLAKRYGWGEWGTGKPRHKFKSFAANCRKWSKRPYICKSCGFNSDDRRTKGGLLYCAKCECFRKFHRKRIFPSLCDPWDKEVPLLWRLELLYTAWQCGNLDFLLLSKRVELWCELMNDCWKHSRNALLARFIESPTGRAILPPEDEADSFRDWLQKWIECGEPPHNVWIGASAEDQQRADERIPELLKIPAKVRFLSVEPLLGPITLHCAHGFCACPTTKIDWVIVGGESGPNARPCNVEWIRSIVRQCKAASVPCFVKQLGSLPYDPVASGNATEQFMSGREVTSNPSTLGVQLKLKHPKGGDPSEWPEDLRVREMPI